MPLGQKDIFGVMRLLCILYVGLVLICLGLICIVQTVRQRRASRLPAPSEPDPSEDYDRYRVINAVAATQDRDRKSERWKNRKVK